MKFWITKYALTKGVICMDAEIVDGKYASTRHTYDIFTQEFERTELAARATFERMRKLKISSLEKQIAKLRDMTFTVQS